MGQLEQKLRADLAIAKSELGAVRQQIGELISREELIEWQVQYIDRLLGNSPKADDNPSQRTEAHDSLAGTTASNAIEAVLRSMGKPMRVVDIVEQAIMRGHGGPNPDARKVFANFSSVLSRAVKTDNSIFTKVGRGIFGLNLPSSASD